MEEIKKNWQNFEKIDDVKNILLNFKKFDEMLKKIWRNFENILMKFWNNLTNLKKFNKLKKRFEKI